MSLILTLTGKSWECSRYNLLSAIDLSDDDYEFSLMNFETYNTISNVNASNKFYFNENDVEITIPEGSYELHAINDFLKHAIPRKRSQHAVHDDKKRGIVDDDVNKDFPVTLHTNNNTMKSEIKCIYRINFSKPNNNIGSLLEYSSHRILQPRK